MMRAKESLADETADSTRARRSGDSTPNLVQAIVRYVKKTIVAALVTALLAGCAFVSLNLFRGTWLVTPVLSGSMRPGFAVGGVVISQRTPLKEIAVRDVIVFQNPIKRTEQMIHRIIKLTHEPSGAIKIETKGDNNPVRDPWTVLVKTRFVYRIRYSLPLVGYLAVAFQNHRPYFVMAAGLLVLLSGAGTWLNFLRRSDAKDQELNASDEEGAGSAPTGRSALAMDVESAESRDRTPAHASRWGVRWQRSAADPGLGTATATVLRPYRVVIRLLTTALIAALGLLGASADERHRGLFFGAAALLLVVVGASTLLCFRTRPEDAGETEDSDATELVPVDEPVDAERLTAGADSLEQAATAAPTEGAMSRMQLADDEDADVASANPLLHPRISQNGASSRAEARVEHPADETEESEEASADRRRTEVGAR